jgi:hypothetical protein
MGLKEKGLVDTGFGNLYASCAVAIRKSHSAGFNKSSNYQPRLDVPL